MSHVVFPLTPGTETAPITPFKDAGITKDTIDFFSPGGSIGVSFFFILSGFVITWAARPGQSTPGYYRRRIVKIFPNHLVTWALAMLLFASAYTPKYGIPNLFFVNAYTTDTWYWGGANMPAWSLCSEMLFYLLFPLLIIPIRKIPDGFLWLGSALAIVGMAAMCLVTVNFVTDTPVYPGEQISTTQFWFIYMFPPVRLFEFLLGMMLARTVLAGRWPKIGFIPVAVLLVLGYYGALKLDDPWGLTLATSVPFALAIGTFAAANIEGRRTIIGSRPMVWLGNISFGFFMTQAIVLFWGREEVLGKDQYGPVGGTVLILALIGVNIICGWLLFKLVEQPAMRYLSRSRKEMAAARDPQGGEPHEPSERSVPA